MSKTVGQLLTELQALKTEDEAKSYLIKALRSEGREVWSNILYVTGYLGNEERTRILNLFDVAD